MDKDGRETGNNKIFVGFRINYYSWDEQIMKDYLVHKSIQKIQLHHFQTEQHKNANLTWWQKTNYPPVIIVSILSENPTINLQHFLPWNSF